MRIKKLHDWDVSPGEARRLQQELARQVALRPLPERIGLVAGADVAVSRGAGSLFAAVVLLSFPELETVEVVTARAPAAFPYVPGLLTFREGPAVIEAFRRLRGQPDAVIFDGQGLAHPRRIGLASHIGLWLGTPTVGCAKSRLTGRHLQPRVERGATALLMDGEEQIGLVLRTRAGVKPVYVSPGHLCDFEGAGRLVLDCCRGYRLPEPTRRAHLAVGEAKRRFLAGQGP